MFRSITIRLYQLVLIIAFACLCSLYPHNHSIAQTKLESGKSISKRLAKIKIKFDKSYANNPESKKTLNLGNLYAGLTILNGNPNGNICSLVDPLKLTPLKRRSTVERKKKNLASDKKVISRIQKKLNTLTYKIVGARFIKGDSKVGFDDNSSLSSPDSRIVELKASDALVGYTNGRSYWGNYVDLIGTTHDGSLGTIVYGWGGLAISGGRFDKQMDYKFDTKTSEKIALIFSTIVNNIELELSRMTIAEWKGEDETGFWEAFDIKKKKIASGFLVPSETKGSRDTFTFPINASKVKSLVIYPVAYGKGNIEIVKHNDNSDFNISGLKFTFDESVPVPDAKVRPTPQPTAIPTFEPDAEGDEDLLPEQTPTIAPTSTPGVKPSVPSGEPTPKPTQVPEVPKPTRTPIVIEEDSSITLNPSDVIMRGEQLPASWGDLVEVTAFQPDETIGTVYSSGSGIGVVGIRHRGQIDFDPEYGASESIELIFNKASSNINITISSLNNNESEGLSETGIWRAFRVDGSQVAKGLITPSRGTKIKDGRYEFSIKTEEKVKTIVISATPYGNGRGLNIFDDNSDFSISKINFLQD